MKECFVVRNFTDESLRKINLVNGILGEYATEGYDLSLRQLYYQLVARDFIEDSQRSYKRLGDLVNNGGEQIEIQIPGDQEYGQSRYWIPIEKIDYDDVAPWPTSPDGGGDSLQRINPNTYGRDYSNWQAATPNP